MKITVSESDLVNAINTVYRAVPSKTTMNILKCILIDAAGQKITFIANDMELGIQTSIEGTIEEKGIVAVDADILSGIVRKLPDGDVLIETTDKSQVRIKCGSAKFEIGCNDGLEFTRLPEIEKNEGINVSEFTFREIINRTIFSISDNDSNKLMTGELLEIKDGNMRIVGLDGHRIAIRRTELNGSYSDRRVVIPGKTLGEVAKILPGDMDKQVSIFFTNKQVLFEFDETLVVSRLIDGEYFRIDQILSDDYETKMTVNRQELQSCIDRALLLVREGDKKPVVFSVTPANVEIMISTDLGRMDENIVCNSEGREIMIGFNPKFLLDALRAIDDEEIDMYFVNPKAPCFIRNTEQTYNYVVLPVNFTTV